ncbi:hypothetical protein C1N53_18825 [Pontibacter sp. SGAir0037]|nr:hypothetical protein C1N53_18825 [Pontibacter sp. SGAir0037]
MNYRSLLLIPLLILTDILTFSEIAALLRTPSDMAVAGGVLLLLLLLIFNFIIIRYIITKLKA